MYRKSILVFVSALMFLILAADAFASASCKTRSRCRWWAKEYVATATVRCLFNPIPLCHRRSASCGTANANCSWRSCPVGGARANATNGPGGCFVDGARSGWGRYGEPLVAAKKGSEEGEGAHDLASRVEFLEGEGVMLYLDHLAMSSTFDDSFSRFDVLVFVESEEGLANDDDDFPPERVVWQGYIHLQNGVLTQQGFDEETREYSDGVDLLDVIIADAAKRIPVEVTADEFERLAVKVMIDGGQPEEDSGK